MLPIPYEMTTTYIKGTSKGPAAILEASKNLEVYDEELGCVAADLGICTLGNINIKKDPRNMVDAVRKKCLQVINDRKFPVVLGGEHSISIGFAKALKQKFPDLTVVQFDAHADLRESYLGSRYNHACVMARIREFSDAVQVGIRSLSKYEGKLVKKNNYKILWAKDIKNPNTCARKILKNASDNIYITFDLDVLDPGLMSAVGTPEPGGLRWYDVLAILKKLFQKKNVVGFDVVELCPNKIDNYSNFTAAKLVYKMLGYKFFS